MTIKAFTVPGANAARTGAFARLAEPTEAAGGTADAADAGPTSAAGAELPIASAQPTIPAKSIAFMLYSMD